jgi:hypothetical protein
MYTNDRHDVMAFRYAEELQIEAEPVPSWTRTGPGQDGEVDQLP